MASAAALLEGTLGYWAGAFERRATALDVALDGARWWQAMTDRTPPSWATPHELAFETPVARLRDFSQGSRRRVTPTLLLPPQAGHDSCIVDFSERQSQVRTIRAAGLERLFSLDWVGATQESKDSTIDDYIDVVDRAVEEIGGPVNLIGDCQGGWLATIWAALRPDLVNTLTIGGAPIDFHAGKPVIGDWVAYLSDQADMTFYRSAVAAGNGVLDGRFILNGFVGIKPENEISKQLQLLAHLHEQEHRERYRAFEDWFKHTQDLAGPFYLWIVEHLFRDNALIQGELELGGKRVDLAAIDAPLNLLAGSEDHITPPAQVFALAGAASTPASKVAKDTAKGGHLGLFMGSGALRDHWPPLLANVLEHSRQNARKGDARRQARKRTPKPPRTIPAP